MDLSPGDRVVVLRDRGKGESVIVEEVRGEFVYVRVPCKHDECERCDPCTAVPRHWVRPVVH